MMSVSSWTRSLTRLPATLMAKYVCSIHPGHILVVNSCHNRILITTTRAATSPMALAVRAITLSVLVRTLTGPPAKVVIPMALVASLVASLVALAPVVTTLTGPLAKVVALTAPVASLTVAAVWVLPATTPMALPAATLTVPVVFPVASLAASVVTTAGVAWGKSVVTSEALTY